MLCEYCGEEIKFGGVIESGLPYHKGCFNDMEIAKKEELLSHKHNLKGLDGWLVNYFNENPIDAKVASEKAYFAILTIHLEDENVHITEYRDTLEEFEYSLSERLIFDNSYDAWNCTIEYMFKDQSIVDFKTKIKVFDIQE